ncbi:beta-ketoacyl-[acyl-carrier-protein] synthase family protein [Bailinhaonella thermotolerans]|uniref:Beta-ketoacyl-[acyl-carrier-protein] synthase family protein n=1 Tax=Bailinhaonella thermotolerans TaxID=1070861 RepID=A0A3A4B380_9ACTN|nr:beta-ketoacyl-[acyl-carrier-protein] synthase family protein [Bailinhaonella thermotolerans]RJL36175.1 beta-ketoacyl-[acyl-carrier-protein] synthase family protein [Bailinhaonella thermotolerans]
MGGTDGIAVTGLGATTPLGGRTGPTWEGLLAGSSGVTAIEEDWAGSVPVRIAARMRVDPAQVLGRVRARRLDRCQQAALVAAHEAWADAGAPDVDPVRLAVVIGTGVGGIQTALAQDDLLEEAGQRRVSPYTIPMMMPNGPAAAVSMEFGARAGAHTPVSACASGAEAIALGLDLIRLGRADVVIAGGVEACLHPLIVAGFARARALSPFAGDPRAASRPFARDRDGFVLGEGAAVLVLERPEFAAARGARVHAALAGAACGSDAFHITGADSAGQARTMRGALASAGLGPRDVQHVSAHATSTPSGDATEARSIAEAIGDHPAVTAIKSMTGHLCGAAGALAALTAVLTLREGVIPPTRNLAEQDPGIPLDVVTEPRRGAWTTALVNAFGFGGHNASLLFTAV